MKAISLWQLIDGGGRTEAVGQEGQNSQSGVARAWLVTNTMQGLHLVLVRLGLNWTSVARSVRARDTPRPGATPEKGARDSCATADSQQPTAFSARPFLKI